MPESSKRYTVKITETAWDMLIAHSRFLANVNISAANRLIDMFVEMSDSLASLPDRNPWLDHEAIPYQKYRKLLFGKHYMTLYEIRGDIVFISAVVDCRQEYRWIL